MMRRIFLYALAMILASAAGPGAHGGGYGHVHGPGAAHGGGPATGIGQPGDPANVARTIEVEMSDDMRFRPAEIRVKRGETIRFVVRNIGNMDHEMVIGTIGELKKHAEEMRNSPGMRHEEPNQAGASPGRTAELIWHFNRAGTVDFACLHPGHSEMGMVGKILVGRE